MSRVGIIMIAVFLTSNAHAIDCRADLPSKRGEYWSYRIIDGRKCWYAGRPMMSKSLLRWRAPVTAPVTAPKLRPVSIEMTGSIAIDAFEERWRKLAPEVQWLIPAARWPLSK
jgi:hypothetical protein